MPSLRKRGCSGGRFGERPIIHRRRFVIREGQDAAKTHAASSPAVPYPFASAKDLLNLAATHQCSFSSLARANERVFRSDAEISQKLQLIWQTMQQCVERGCETKAFCQRIEYRSPRPRALQIAASPCREEHSDPMTALDWIDLYAIAVNEENAAGGRVVTAPTNGAAGIIPAVLHYLVRLCHGTTDQQVEQFLLTAAVIARYTNATHRSPVQRLGCQGEVGVACSMAPVRLPKCLAGRLSRSSKRRRLGWNTIWG